MTTSGNVFRGKYREDFSHCILGCMCEREFTELHPDIRGTIRAVRRGVVSEKKFKCREGHPLWSSYEQCMDRGRSQIERQLSDERIRADLLAYLDELLGPGQKPGIKEQLCGQFFQSIGARLRSIRVKADTLLHEMVMNVIEHGMQHDPRDVGFVNIGMNPTGEFDIVTFSDRAFDHRNLAQATFNDESVLRESGKGLYMIRALPSHHQFSDTGRYLIVQFHVRKDAQAVLAGAAQTLGVPVDIAVTEPVTPERDAPSTGT